MTPEELAAIEARANAATDGPWEYVADRRTAAMLKSCRLDIPALLAEVRERQAEIAAKDFAYIEACDSLEVEIAKLRSELERIAAVPRYSTEAVDALMEQWDAYVDDPMRIGVGAEFVRAIAVVRASLEPKP